MLSNMFHGVVLGELIKREYFKLKRMEKVPDEVTFTLGLDRRMIL